MKVRLGAAGIVAAALFTVSCATKPEPAPGPKTSVLYKSSWSAVNINGEAVPDGAKITLEFGDAKIAGSGGCNRFFGAYEENGWSLKVHGIGATKVACAAPIMARETTYLAILGDVVSYKQDSSGGIVVTAKDGRTITLFPNAS